MGVLGAGGDCGHECVVGGRGLPAGRGGHPLGQQPHPPLAERGRELVYGHDHPSWFWLAIFWSSATMRSSAVYRCPRASVSHAWPGVGSISVTVTVASASALRQERRSDRAIRSTDARLVRSA